MTSHRIHRRAVAIAALLAGTIGLAACGGGGGGGEIASAPTPIPAPAPTPVPAPAPTPAHLTSISIERVAPLSDRAGMTAGTFDTKAIISDSSSSSASQILAPGAVRLGIDPARPTYTVTATVAGFPAQESFDFSLPIAFTSSGTPFDRSGFGHHVIRIERYSDNSTRTSGEDITVAQYSAPRDSISGGGYEDRSLYLDISHRYVSLGGWIRDIYEPVPGSTGAFRYLDAKRVSFVQGIRTEPADIPTSGTATYRDEYTPFSLLADFGARRIGADIAYPFCECSDIYEGGPSDGLSARGSAAIASDGNFLIPLTGSFVGATGAATAAFTGTIDGAFFGPQAAEVGGVFQFFKGGTEYQAGTFAAAKRP